jgi:hypothetical protein
MKSYKVSFDPLFRQDILDARKWYEQRKKGLGKRFYADVKKSLKAIQKTPHYQIRYHDIRCLPLTTFPFMIHYAIDDYKREVTIYGCIHCSLNPDDRWFSE